MSTNISQRIKDEVAIRQTVEYLREAMRMGGVEFPEFQITVPIHRNPEEDPAAFAYTDPSDIIVVARGSASNAIPPLETGQG